MSKIALIGYGYWGPNLARNFSHHTSFKLKYVCELSAAMRVKASQDWPQATIVDDVQKILDDPTVTAVAIATPAESHYGLIERCLTAGKHVLVEKPFVTKLVEASQLISLADKHKLILAVDHTFLFTSAVQEIRSLIERNEVGLLTYFDSVRVNLGKFQDDTSVLWDLAPHDLSILYYLNETLPSSVICHGVDHLNLGFANMAYLTLVYPNNFIASLHLNWLSPVKVRKIMIGGSKQMVVFDDMETSEKLKVYDCGASKAYDHSLKVNYRSGAMSAPVLENTEALKRLVEEFEINIKTANPNFPNDAFNASKVISTIEAAERSLISNQAEPIIWLDGVSK